MKRLQASNLPLILVFMFTIGLFTACNNSSEKTDSPRKSVAMEENKEEAKKRTSTAEKNNKPISTQRTSNFSLTDGKLGYPSVSSFLFDINFDGELDSLVVFPGEGQRGRTDFIAYNLDGAELADVPYTLLDSETKIDIVAKELIIFNSGGACGGITDIYKRKDNDLRLVKRLKQNMEDSKCIESTYEVDDDKESFVSKKELTN